MSHEVETMAYVGEAPWHGLGTYVGDDPVDSATMIKAAGLDWDVEMRQVYVPMIAEPDSPGDFAECEDHRAVVRVTDNAVLGVTGKVYTPVQNRDAFRALDTLVESGDLRYHTAGSLRGGKRVWALAKFAQSEIVKDDLVDHFLFLHNAHDGSRALDVMFTPVRVVCANTARAALDAETPWRCSLRHTTEINENIIEQVRATLGNAVKQATMFDEFCRVLATRDMKNGSVKKWLEAAFPLAADASERVIDNVEENRGTLYRLFEGGKGNDLPGVKGTAYAAFNATTEFASHNQGGDRITTESRFSHLIWGEGAALVQRVVDHFRAAA
jgi:phage/plasmid-like protein (TIGR03299 family)